MLCARLYSQHDALSVQYTLRPSTTSQFPATRHSDQIAVSMQNTCESSPPMDASSLRAALSVIDDWELDFGFLFAAGGDSAQQETVEKTSPRRQLSCSTASSAVGGEEAPRAPYRGRNRRRLEVLALREQAERLQRQLVVSTRIADEAAVARGKGTKGQDHKLQELKGVWEDLSRRQRMQRQFAEAENDALRAELKAHIQTARKLLGLSRRALKTPGLARCPFDEEADFNKPFLSAVEHLAQVDDLFSHASSVFSKPVYTSGRREFQNIQVTEDSANGTVVVFEVSLLLPFDVKGVADALYQHTVRMTSNERVYEFKDILQPDDDSLVSLYVGLSTGSDIEGTMQGQIATKKFVTGADSALVVSKIYADVLNTDYLPFHMSGEGWLRCVEVHQGIPTTSDMDGSCSKTSPLTQVQWFRCIRIRSLNPARAPRWTDLRGMIATRVKHSLDWNLQAVENLLLSQSRRKFGALRLVR